VFRVTLACDAVFKISRYKVKAGHTLTVLVDGVVFAQRTAPTGVR